MNQSLRKKLPNVRHGWSLEAKKEWSEWLRNYGAIGILTEVDMAHFAGYCQAYAGWKEAEEFLSKHGNYF